MTWTLNKRLVLMMVLLSTLLLAIMFAFNLYVEREMYRVVAKNIRELTHSIHVTLDEMTKDDPSDRKLLSALQEINANGVKEIDIIDYNLTIVASTDPAKKGQRVSEATSELLFKAEQEGKLVSGLRIVSSTESAKRPRKLIKVNPDLLFRVAEGRLNEQGDYYNIVLPVITFGERQGYIRLIVDAREITSDLDAIILRRMALTGVLLLFGIIGAVWLASRYTRPILDVAQAAGRVSAGDLSVRLDIEGSDEVAALGRSFNKMVERLGDLRALEERLRRAEYLATVGELSSQMAHEIRNPLNYISLSVDHIGEKIADEQTRSMVTNIKHEITRLDRLVNDFLAYGRPLRLERRPVPLDELVDSALLLIRPKAETARIRIVKDLGEAGGRSLTVDYDLMKTCLLNLLINALQAMPGGGEVRVLGNRNDGWVSIAVEDTGPGLDEERAAHVFDPFFTTKDEGIGLGLPITKRVVEEHGGRVRFRSAVGAGSAVEISLPDR